MNVNDDQNAADCLLVASRPVMGFGSDFIRGLRRFESLS